MEDSKKKPIMIGVVVACLVLAGVITFMRSSGSPGGLDKMQRGEMMWVKCNNPDCKSEYQIDKKDYFKYVEEHADPIRMNVPPLVCKDCGEESVFRAIKCEKCELVFFKAAAAPGGGITDRCPECGYSKQEELRR